MRHKYDTRGIVLARMPFGEAHARLAILTNDLGLVWARAAGLRRAGGKLAAALITFAESDVTLVRGREGWRVTGAVLAENWFSRLRGSPARRCAARVAGLVLRLSPGETPDGRLLPTVRDFLGTLADSDPASYDGAELIAAASVLAALGWSDDAARASRVSFAPDELARAKREREGYVARINRGIAASGL